MRLFRGAVAQLIERYIRIVEARGLSPLSSTTLRAAKCAPRSFNGVGRYSCGRAALRVANH